MYGVFTLHAFNSLTHRYKSALKFVRPVDSIALSNFLLLSSVTEFTIFSAAMLTSSMEIKAVAIYIALKVKNLGLCLKVRPTSPSSDSMLVPNIVSTRSS